MEDADRDVDIGNRDPGADEGLDKRDRDANEDEDADVDADVGEGMGEDERGRVGDRGANM